jgi:pimeloyl-ACP methyl ester carboxylesterase
MERPGWFVRALEVPCTHHAVDVDGAAVHYVAWGSPGRRGLVFVHGGGANTHWWTHIAARFAGDFRVLALDLSGHGDSDHRDRYDLLQWTDEVMAVARDGGIVGRPVVVGHSMGGFVTIVTAARYHEELTGVIVCDSPVVKPDPEVEAHHVGQAFGRPKVYERLEDAVARFRTVPAQMHYLDYVMDNIARHSLRQVEGVGAARPGEAPKQTPDSTRDTVPGGWQWKLDRRIFEQFHGSMRGVALPYLDKIHCRFALLRSEYGLVTPTIGASMYEALGRVAPVIEIPEAGHHAMLDQPLSLLTAIRTLLADWDHSEPLEAADP